MEKNAKFNILTVFNAKIKDEPVGECLANKSKSISVQGVSMEECNSNISTMKSVATANKTLPHAQLNEG